MNYKLIFFISGFFLIKLNCCGCCDNSSTSSNKKNINSNNDPNKNLFTGNWDKKYLVGRQCNSVQDLKENIMILLQNNLLNDEISNRNVLNFVRNGTFVLDDLLTLYNEMTNDIFNSEAAITFITYILILRYYGIDYALSKIITKDKLNYWSYYNFTTQNDKTYIMDVHSDSFYMQEKKEADKTIYNVFIDDNLIPNGYNSDNLPEDIKEYNNGQIDVENEAFKYLRCDGCNNANCVSCKFRDLLIKENLLDKNGKGKLMDVFQGQGNDSNGHSAIALKKIVISLLKDEFKSIDFYKIEKIKEEKIDDNEMKDIKKIFFIEWALTYEFLRRFCKVFYNDKLDLFRSLRSDTEINEITKIAPFESTSIFGPVFLTTVRPSTINYNFFRAEHVKYYRCIFNYVISPCKSPILRAGISIDVSYEQEIGFIPVGIEYKKMKGENWNNEHFINALEYMRKESKRILKQSLENLKKGENIEVEINEEFLPDYYKKMSEEK